MDSLRLLTRGSGFKVAPNSTPRSQERPSSGLAESHSRETSPSGKKRKRAEYEADSNASDKTLSQDEIRRIQKLHKIKITDLRALRNEAEHESRKVQKEASRLYPQPLQTFSTLRNTRTNHALLANLAEQAYREPTEVQLATIPLLMPGDGTEPNLLTVAPTGSGKTLAFLIPLIDKVSKAHQAEDHLTSQRRVGAIILAPTKELVAQIVNEGRKLTEHTGVRITAFKKGMKLHEDIATAEHGDSASEAEDTVKRPLVRADILVSTPLSLLNAITLSSSSTPLHLRHVHHLILDEADVLLDPLFRDQTLSIWSACTNPALRTSLWSATIGSNIEELALSTITARESTLKIQPTSRPPLLRCIIGLKDTSLPNITHKLIYASTEAGKLTGLRQLIRPPPSNTNTNPASSKPQSKQPPPLLRPPFLIFTQTIPRATALHSELQYDIPPSTSPSTHPDSNVPRIALLHSSLTTPQRTAIMHNVRAGKIWILITTDLLSRGIDFRGVNGVVNYDIPTTSASYVHRAGRTGRAGRNGGVCVTFYTREDVRYLRPIANVIGKSRGDAESASASGLPPWLLDALPVLTKQAKKDLRERGVDVRRAVKESDDKKERRRKGRNAIGTKTGYEKKLENRRRGMVEGSRRRKAREQHGQQSNDGVDGGEGDSGSGSGGEDDFAGFD
ncbi:RNA-dependent ATPase rok1 [Exophiala xenobiotica]|uniref:ATP-dependent RNA helicase ROK1 n=1 Tax=Lithohypha guttulata TaxID=1690604 RepID=A0ABR0KII9_9EURO|nr:RNA-dependent ATPase rok1 [Lithohypha guttulata]KAK5323671.1 RNA-dependent ATPase rok1 [Exophiala xenobiotica]